MSLLKYFYRQAMDLPEWMPDWIKKHPEIKKAPNNIKKQFPFDDFNKKIDNDGIIKQINDGLIDIFAHNINNFLSDLFHFITYVYDDDVLNVRGCTIEQVNLFIKKRKAIVNIFDGNVNKETIKFALKNKYIEIGKNKYKLFALIQKAIDFSNEFAYLILSAVSPTNYERIKHLFNTTRKFEEIDGFSLFSKKDMNKDLYVVFSTKPADILRMSSSSNWTSCQNIFSGIANSCLTGNVLHSGTGIIYITNNKDFNGTGSEIIYRSIVRLLKKKESETYVCLLSNIYPINSKAIIDLFKQSIEENGIKVLEPDDDISNYELAFTHEDYEYTYNAYEEPKTNKPEKYNLLNQNWENNKNLKDTKSLKNMLSNKIERELFFEQFEKSILNSGKSEIMNLMLFGDFLTNNGISKEIYREFVRNYKAWKAGNKYLDDIRF